MDISKGTITLLRKRLRKQKIRTFIMFIIGLLLGAVIAFNIYYWFPLLKEEFSLTDLKQFPINENEPTLTSSSSTSDSTTTTESTNSEEESKIIPRMTFNETTKISPVYQELNKELEQAIDQYNPSGTILAIKNNQVVLLNNYGSAKEDLDDPINSTYMIASVQKAITAILIMKLIEEQKLTLDTPLADYFTDIPNSQSITIDQLLSMTSGLTLKEKLKTTTSKEESIQYVEKNVTYEPLTKWAYSDVNYFLLAAIIEKVSGKSYEDYFDEIIKQPLNLTHTGFYNEITENTHLIPSHSLNSDGSIDDNPVKITEANFINELGTGNMYISAGDLVTIIQAEADGELISNDVLKNTMTIQPANYTYNYKAGFYDRDSYFFSHGIFKDYEPNVLVSRDASTMVIYLSNVYDNRKNNNVLSENLYQILYQLP